MEEHNKGETVLLRTEEENGALTKPITELTSWLTNPYLKAATADNTRRAYRSDVRHFERWGGKLPATTESIIHYLQHYAPLLNPRTLARRITALKQWHLYQGFPDPTHHPAVSKTVKGILRLHGKPVVKAHPLAVSELLRLVEPLQSAMVLRDARDNALFQMAFCGALRRSEVVKLRVEDLTFVEEGIDVMIPHSKTDPSREGQLVAIPYGIEPLCPITALKRWLVTADISAGYIFRHIKKGNRLGETPLSMDAVNLLLKERAAQCGLSVTTLSSHSFRRGITTSASHAGSDLAAIMRHGRWKDVKTVLEYIDASERFSDNVAAKALKNIK